jgi:DNA-binding Xre family transcriptional regulator
MEDTLKNIAICLKKTMKKKGITANQIIVKTGMCKTTVYSVLQMGKFKPNYEINSLLKICNHIGIKLHELPEKNNVELKTN